METQALLQGEYVERILEWSMGTFAKTEINMSEIVERLKEFMEQEARSCSMDFGCITPLYVYRMWGGAVAVEDIATAMEDVRRRM